MLLAADQAQGFLWPWAELTAHTQPRGQLPQQRDGAIGGEIVEAQQGFPPAATPLIGGEQVQLAAHAVA